MIAVPDVTGHINTGMMCSVPTDMSTDQEGELFSSSHKSYSVVICKIQVKKNQEKFLLYIMQNLL